MDNLSILLDDTALASDHEIPRNAKPIELVEAYLLDEKIPCGIASCHTPHFKGMIVAYQCDDGTKGRGRVGHVCGHRAFGADWNTLLKSFKSRQNLAALQQRAAGTLETCASVELRLEQLRELAALVDGARVFIADGVPSLMVACSDAAKSDRRVRRWTRGGYQGKGVPLPGPGFWTRGAVSPTLNRLGADIRLFTNAAGNPTTKVQRLNDMLAKLGLPSQRLAEVEQQIADGVDALNPSELARVVGELMKNSDGFDATLSNGLLRRSGTPLPAGLGLPMELDLNAITRAAKAAQVHKGH